VSSSPRPVAALAVAAVLAAALPARAGDVEPRLALVPPTPGDKVVALTFDACSGAFDDRIGDYLVENAIPATIFVTHRWMRRNADAMATFTARPDLFQIEDHGEEHVPAVTDRSFVFGLKTAGDLEAVKAEVDGGAAAILAATGVAPHWFRGATARYSTDAVAAIEAEGYRIAGYSLNADVGASLSQKAVARRIAAAKPGDVVIAHINQPTRPAGAGVVDGIETLRTAGWRFVRLDDVEEVEGK